MLFYKERWHSCLLKAVTLLVSSSIILFFVIPQFETNGCNGMTKQPPMQPSETDDFLIVMQELPEWEPGLPRIIHQIALDNQGHGQRVELENRQITMLDLIHVNKELIENICFNNIFKLNNSYTTNIPGLIVEGHPSSYKFMIFDMTLKRMKIIDSESDLMPDTLLKIKKQVEQLKFSCDEPDETGLFLMAKPLGPQGSEEVYRMTTLKAIDLDVLNRIDSLREAMENPSLLIHVPDDQYAKMRVYFGNEDLSAKHGLFFPSRWGVVKLEFYHYNK